MVFLLAVALSLTSLVTAAETVEITQKSSNITLPVIVEKVSNGRLTFRASNGERYERPLSELTDDSVARVRAYLEAKAAAPSGDVALFARLNELIGHPFFGEKNLWDEEAGEVAKRLGWRMESRTDRSSSYRSYTAIDYQFLNAHPYCTTIYGGPGDKTERISLVYANKGDFGSRLGFGPEHFREAHPDREPPGDLEEAIEADAELIGERLTQGLGEPEKQYYGERDDRRAVQRWDLGEHALLLSTLEGEYTSLLIVPAANADNEGKVDFITDSDFRKMQVRNVIREARGDVLIKNIPMVDQGPKGYCAPATFERAMRYMNVPADMYLLATSATDVGGGTNTRKLSEDCKKIVRSKARRIRELELEEDFEIDELKDYIDEGVPVLWAMRSLDPFNRLVNRRTREREAATDFGAWAREIQTEADEVAPGFATSMTNHHICLIIGYNERTREVAVSDSWGPGYALRWVHVDIARAVTNPGGFVIDF